MNKNAPILNALCIWEAIPTDEFYSKQYSSSRTYKLPNGVIETPTPDRPVFAYAKNYTKGKKDFSLFLYSDSNDEKSIEEFMDKAIKDVKVADVSEALVIASTNGFKYTDKVFKEDK